MTIVLQNVRRDLKRSADRKARESGRTFFKEEVVLYGVKAARIRAIARHSFNEIQGRSKKEVFALCEALWQSGYLEEAAVACLWSYAVRKQYTKGDFAHFEKWVRRYVSNWATCDTLCNHTVGTFLEMYPEYLPKLRTWARSRNRWMRRASAVSLVVPARRGKFLDEIFSIADILLLDRDDMVQKGYGWMLKEASKLHRQQVYAYVLRRRGMMPRTALRYAIELMPGSLRKKAMAKSPAIKMPNTRR